jgi:hypothetical protein
MAIRFGMTLAEIIGQLTRGFMKVMGRKPEALEKIKIQQEAVQRFKDMNKVVDMEGRALDPSKTITGGTQESAALKSGIMKATGAKPKKIQKESLEDFVDDAGGVDPEDMATGGRVGLKKGMDRRTFMKIMGGLTALPILGKFFKGAKTAAPAVEKVTEVARETPSYFFDLVAKIKLLGRQSKIGPQERVNEYSYVGKNGDEYTLTEDIVTGDARIVKDKMGGVRVGEDEVAEGIANRSVMEYKSGKGAVDEGTGGRVADEYDEYEVRFDYDGTEAEADNMSEFIRKEITKEVSSKTPSIKKAGGGIARMLGE